MNLIVIYDPNTQQLTIGRELSDGGKVEELVRHTINYIPEKVSYGVIGHSMMSLDMPKKVNLNPGVN